MLLSSSSGFSRWTPCKTRLFLVPTNIVEEWQTLCLGDLASLPVTVTNCPDKTTRGQKVCFSSRFQLTVPCYGEVTAARENRSHTFRSGAESSELACTLESLALSPFHSVQGTMKCAGHIHSGSSHLHGPSWEPLTGLLSGQHSSDNSPLIPPPQAILHCVNLTATH